jgi:hypothetical protein
MSDVCYHIHNTVRSQATRTQRAANATHSKTVLHLGGGSLRVMRGRPVVVTSDTLRLFHAELVLLEAQGLVKVTTTRGDRINLATMRVEVPAPVAPPLPNPPIDSVFNDKNEGIGQASLQYRGNLPENAEVEVPRLGRRAIPDGESRPALLPPPVEEVTPAPAAVEEVEAAPEVEEPATPVESLPEEAVPHIVVPEPKATPHHEQRSSYHNKSGRRR